MNTREWPHPQLDNAKRFLKAILKNGPVLSADIVDAAKSKNIAWATIKRAKKELKIKHFKQMHEKYGVFYWTL